ncbi:helix-turn-helix domain-containing protein [Pseudomonas sp. SG-MS2]|uniref:helix-turn-helix domain-containing protein n=1 Tax=Pseudomonas sp. SG-MS2 TaxID=1914534 RepID=UPI00137A9BF1|nr:helix-turn-helix domain-containing protein [Pseudomonas sp. SG-MS2]KAF1307004.1 helix-turn-helix domain-containing protein [Pseudomonas sp. SG-MS2]
MSVQSMSWALEQRDIVDATARYVLLVLANYADKNGRGAFPSSASISDDTGLSIRTVKYKLDHLLEIGVIRLGNQAIAGAYIDRHDRRPTVYDLCVERGATAAPGSERGANYDTTGCSSRQNGVQTTTERGAGAAPNPSINHQLTIKEPKASVADAPAGAKKAPKFDPLTCKPANVSDSIWADWCQHRKEIGKRLTKTTCDRQAKTLAGHHAPDAVINQSISNGWTGLFPEKVLPGAQQGQRRNGPDFNDTSWADDLGAL